METNLQNIALVEPPEALTKLYALNKHWLSEINFVNDEIRFMTDLLDRFFIKLIKEEHINRIQLIKMQLISIGFIRNNIKQDISTHQLNIEKKINNISAKSEGFLELEDSRVEDEMHDLQKAFKKVKTEIFNITRTLLHDKNE